MELKELNELEIGTVGHGGCACGDFRKRNAYSISASCHRSSGCSVGGYEHSPCVEYDKKEGRAHAKKIADYIAHFYYGAELEEPQSYVKCHKAKPSKKP